MSGIEGAECEDFDDGEAGVGRLRTSAFGLCFHFECSRSVTEIGID
jgi:hypothetical protein